MKEIFNLIKLDFITVKRKSLLPIIILTVGMSALSFFIMPYLSVAFIVFSGLIVQPVFVIVDQCGYNKLYGILPVKKRNIVAGRFAFGVIAMLSITLFSVIGGLLSYRFNIAENFGGDLADFVYLARELTENGFTIPLAAAFMFLFACLFSAVEYAILFIFGTSKELPAILGIGFILAGITIVINKLLKIDLSVVGDFLGNMVTDHIALLYICLYGGGIALMVLGALISSIFFCKREL